MLCHSSSDSLEGQHFTGEDLGKERDLPRSLSRWEAELHPGCRSSASQPGALSPAEHCQKGCYWVAVATALGAPENLLAAAIIENWNL